MLPVLSLSSQDTALIILGLEAASMTLTKTGGACNVRASFCLVLGHILHCASCAFMGLAVGAVSNHSAMTNMSHHATLWRSFPKHNSLAGGSGRTQVSFSALGSPRSWKQVWTAATAAHAEYTRAPWKKLQQTVEKYHEGVTAPFARQKEGDMKWGCQFLLRP